MRAQIRVCQYAHSIGKRFLDENRKINCNKCTTSKDLANVFWDRSPEWLGLIKEAERTSEKRDTVSACYHLLGKAAGRKFEFDVEFTDLVENEKCSWRSISGNFTGFGTCIHASGTTTLTPMEGGTKMTIIMNYYLPYSILGWIIDKLVVGREMKKGLKKGQEKMKSILEE